MIKGVIFDLGRTLIYLGERCSRVDATATAALIEFLCNNGISVDQDFPSRFLAAREVRWKLAEKMEREQTMDEVLLATLPLSNVSSLEEIVKGAVETYFEAREKYWLANSGAVEMLGTLAERGLRLGVISNSEHDGLMRKAVERLGFSPYLNPVITSAEVKWRKPNPHSFRLIMDSWGMRPDEIVMVGDSLHEDIAGAYRVGMRSILVDHLGGRSSKKRTNSPVIIRPDAVTRHLKEVPGAINRIQKQSQRLIPHYNT